MRKIRVVLITLILVIVAGIGWVVYAIQPTADRNLTYDSIPWVSRIGGAFLNHGVVSLTNVDLDNLFKAELVNHQQNMKYTLKGADLQLESDQIRCWIVVQDGFVPIEISFTATVRIDNQDLLLTPRQYWIGRIAMKPNTFQSITSMFQNQQLASVYRIPLKLPPGLKLQTIVVQPGTMQLHFELQRMF